MVCFCERNTMRILASILAILAFSSAQNVHQNNRQGQINLFVSDKTKSQDLRDTRRQDFQHPANLAESSRQGITTLYVSSDDKDDATKQRRGVESRYDSDKNILPDSLNPRRNQSLSNNQKERKKSTGMLYVCPPGFLRLSHRCYYFSKKMATWQDAYFECRHLKSNLAIIRNANQDKLIKRTLNKKTLDPLERWIGGIYDWEQMRWKWGASGKPVVYQGFSRIETDKTKLKWHCTTVDPKLQYKWNSKKCTEEKHFICHTKIKMVTKKGKKKLQRQYNANNDNKLNEIPVPELPDRYNNAIGLKTHQPNSINFDISNDLNAEFALRPAEKRKRRVKHRQRIERVHKNGTVTYEIPAEIIENRKRRYRYRNEKEIPLANPNHIRWRTYFEDNKKNPLMPRPIVEEYNFMKD